MNLMFLLGIDVGTTHCKAAVFDRDGTLLEYNSRLTPIQAKPNGFFEIDPQELWQVVADVTKEVVSKIQPGAIAALGIASMAETGLLLDSKTGAVRTPFIPWFDTRATCEAEWLFNIPDPAKRFSHMGNDSSYKSSLAKLLWLRKQAPALLEDATWLSTADYCAYRFTGQQATDYSLAGRTYAFRIDQKDWDRLWLQQLGISVELFPRLNKSGAVIGGSLPQWQEGLGLPAGTPVAICGHDHVCAAFAVSLAAGGVTPGQVFDSMGTAESLMGTLKERDLGEHELHSGLGFGCHAAPGYFYWMGGLSASGGSIEWLRGVLGEPLISYETLEGMLTSLRSGPGNILFLPYLSGSGSPHTDARARGAFIGLSVSHGPADLFKAILEGTAYEFEFIRRTAEETNQMEIRHILAAGGGTRMRAWMQIKADVTGCLFETWSMPEATLLGAALLAGIGSGYYSNANEAAAILTYRPADSFYPDETRHKAYRQRFEQGFLPLQAPIRQYSRSLTE